MTKKNVYNEHEIIVKRWWGAPGDLDAADVIDEARGVRGIDFVEAAQRKLQHEALLDGSTLYYASHNSHVMVTVIASIEDYIINNLQARKVLERVSGGTSSVLRSYIWPDGAVFFNCEEGYGDDDAVDEFWGGDVEEEVPVFNLKISISSRNRCDITALNDIISKHYPPPPPPRVHENPGHAYVLANIPMRGISIIPVGLSGVELLRDNYSEDVLRGFDKTVKDFHEQSPSGRLVLLEGCPGSGKTYLVRALMNAVPNSKFVIVPPHMISGLADPGLIITFLQEMDSGI